METTPNAENVHKSVIKKLAILVVFIFAVIGFVLIAGYFAVRFGITNEKGIIDDQRNSFISGENPSIKNGEKSSAKNGGNTSIQATSSEWSSGEEWQVLKTAIIRDAGPIYRASYDSGVDSRLIATVMVPEQLRLFYSEREIFKKIFAPLKILGNQSQFSWGIMGLKQETARMIESNLKDKNSPYYLGQKYEGLLDFKTTNVDEERYERITNDKDHYYSYLYAALYIREVVGQWQKAGYDISTRPEIIGTLYNIGFANSHPNAGPSSGGSSIEINGKTYSFGGLAGEFYYSKELKEIFPGK
jgi:hypothetical protein